MFLGEKVRYFVIDEHNKEWIVDMFDYEVLNGDVYLNIPVERVHLILE